MTGLVQSYLQQLLLLDAVREKRNELGEDARSLGATDSVELVVIRLGRDRALPVLHRHLLEISEVGFAVVDGLLDRRDELGIPRREVDGRHVWRR